MNITKLDRWSLELQEFDISLEFIQGKLNTVADVISCLKNEGLYKEHSNEIDLLSNACEFSNLELPLGKYTIVNLCSVFNLFNTLLIVLFLNSVQLSIKMNLDGPICGRIVSM